MQRQQVLKYRLNDSLMTENDTFKIKTVIKLSLNCHQVVIRRNGGRL